MTGCDRPGARTHTCVTARWLLCVPGKRKVTDIARLCKWCRFLSIIAHQGHIHRLRGVALAFSTPGSGRGTGPADRCCF